MKQTRTRRAPEHYVSNKDFTAAVVEYTLRKDRDTPMPDYVAGVF